MTPVDEREREVLKVTVLFWIIAVFLVMVFTMCFCNASQKNRDLDGRREDLEVGIFYICLFHSVSISVQRSER